MIIELSYIDIPVCSEGSLRSRNMLIMNKYVWMHINLLVTCQEEFLTFAETPSNYVRSMNISRVT